VPSLILKPGKERRLIAGHPWVYAGVIALDKDDRKSHLRLGPSRGNTFAAVVVMC
jgi:hypothetical protein